MSIRGNTVVSKQRNLAIDIIRLGLAALIVYMHVADGLMFRNNALNANASIIDFCILVAARLAVPTFFAISGYYFFKKKQSDEYLSAVKNMKRLFLLFMGGLTICFIVSLLLNGFHRTASIVTPSGLFIATFFNRIFIVDYAGPLWFILALIFCYGVYYIFPRFFQKKYLYLIAGALFFISLSSGYPYQGIIMDELPNYVLLSWLCMGLPYFTLGYGIHTYWNDIQKRLPKFVEFKLLALATALYLIEQFVFFASDLFVPNMTIENPITMPLIVASILIATLRHPGKSNAKLSGIAANYSLYIFIIHLPVASILARFIYRNGMPYSVQYSTGILLWVVVIVICVALAYTYTKLKALVVKLLSKNHENWLIKV